MSGEDAVYELTIDQPNLPKGEHVQIPGLGTFENGYSYTISKDEAEGFRTYHTKQVSLHDEAGAIIGSELEKGPTILEASKRMLGVEVTSFDKSQSEDPNKNNAKRAVTTSSEDTSWPISSTAYEESETPTMHVTSADDPVKHEPKGSTSTDTKPTADTKAKDEKGGDKS